MPSPDKPETVQLWRCSECGGLAEGPVRCVHAVPVAGRTFERELVTAVLVPEGSVGVVLGKDALYSAHDVVAAERSSTHVVSGTPYAKVLDEAIQAFRASLSDPEADDG